MSDRRKPRATALWWALPGAILALCSAVAATADGVVAAQTADPACADDSGAVYVDCGNGTVTDNRTGLVWLADASCYREMTWNEVLEVVAGLADQAPTSVAANQDCGLSDGSSPGEWRLPSAAEWEAMIAGAGGCSPRITDDSGTGCWSAGGTSFIDVAVSFYWSSTQAGALGVLAWGVDMTSGLTNDNTMSPGYLWPVRGGQ